MADPEGPPTLFKLAIDALIAGCKLGRYVPTVDPQKIPPAVGNLVLTQISLMDIIIIASNENLYDWIASILPNNFVTIQVRFTDHPSLIKIVFDRDSRALLFWGFVHRDIDSIDQSQLFMLRIGDQAFPTKADGVYFFDSFLPNSEIAERFKIQVKILEWICQLFKRELNHFRSHTDSTEYLKSSAIITAQTVSIRDSTQYTFFEKLLTERHQRGLGARIENVSVAEPLQFSSELFKNVTIILTANLNFNFYSFEEIVQVLTPWIPHISNINAKIPNWSLRDLRAFRKRLNLLQATEEFVSRYMLNDNFGMADSDNCQSFYRIESGTGGAKVFRFIGTENGHFNEMLYRSL